MRVCPRCKKSRRELQTVRTDRRTKKKWLVTYCGSCQYNFELEEKTGKDTMPSEELNKPGTPIWDGKKFI